MKITSIRRQKRQRERVNLYVDGEFRLAIATEVALGRGLHPGGEIDEGELSNLALEDAAWRAKQRGLHLLAFRQRSEAELRQRLQQSGFEAPVVERCLEGLRTAGLLNDELFAAALARDRLRSRPVGRSRLTAELRAKGVQAETIARVLEGLDEGEGESEVELARRAMRKFPMRAGEDSHRRRRRLYGFLGRRGFSVETIGQLLGELQL